MRGGLVELNVCGLPPTLAGVSARRVRSRPSFAEDGTAHDAGDKPRPS